jgi:hypothetical protein
MELKDIMTISGKSGLFKYISQGRNGIIVESFHDKKRTFIHVNTKASSLEDIAIYTEKEEMPLADVFKKIFDKEQGKKTIDHKSSPDELKQYFENILPDYDKDRVYVSDIKKVIYWYNTLANLKLLKFDEKEEKKENEKKEENNEVTEDKAIPKTKTTAKKLSSQSTKQKPQVAKSPATARKGGSAGKKV